MYTIYISKISLMQIILHVRWHVHVMNNAFQFPKCEQFFFNFSNLNYFLSKTVNNINI